MLWSPLGGVRVSADACGVGGVLEWNRSHELNFVFVAIKKKSRALNLPWIQNLFNDHLKSPIFQLFFFLLIVAIHRDRIYRLRLDNLKLLQKAEWEVPKETFETCVQKGQIENDCRNFITVLHEYNHNLLACGTNAYSPNCSWRHIDNLKLIGYETGVGKSPFNPHANISTLMTTDGKMFVASPTDFSSSDPAIIRVDLAVKDSKLFRTKQYEQWFDKPQFVGSFEHDKFVYFVFREVAIELGSGGKAIYSRIARVCKNDNGNLTDNLCCDFRVL